MTATSAAITVPRALVMAPTERQDNYGRVETFHCSKFSSRKISGSDSISESESEQDDIITGLGLVT